MMTHDAHADHAGLDDAADAPAQANSPTVRATLFPLDGVGTDDHRWFVADHGAQVMAWQPAGRHEPVLWSAPEAVWETAPDDQDGPVLRGGVPVCFPWFGAGGVPAHGTARPHDRERVSAEVDERRLEVEDWILLGELEATQTVTMTDEVLEIRLVMTNNGSAPRRVEAAHHSYLAVGGVDGCRIRGLAGAPVWDAVADTVATLPDGDLAITPHTDKVVTSDAVIDLVDDVWRRTIHIEREGSPQVVVWNSRPAVDSSLGVTNDRWDEFVCIETAAVRELAPVLEPGTSHTMVTRISVR